MAKKLLVVFNPYAGLRRANRYLCDVLYHYSLEGYACQVQMTTKETRAGDIVKAYAADCELIVCVGGDGTFSETAAGIVDNGLDVPVGYIPAGSTNDFAQSLGLSKDILTAARDTTAGKTEAFDVGRFNGRVFTYVASFGAFTKASYSAPQDMKNILGHFAYIIEGIKDISDIHPLHMKFTTADGVLEGDYLFGAICNSTSIGGLVKLDRGAVDLSDGLLEVMLIENPRNAGELLEILNALNTKNFALSERISFFSTQKIAIEADCHVDWTLDGEHQEGTEHITIENVRHAIRMKVPQNP